MLEQAGLIARVGRSSKISKKAPFGKYRVIIYNPVTGEERFLGDHPDYNWAVGVAKKNGFAEQANVFVYDNEGDCLWSYLYFKE